MRENLPMRCRLVPLLVAFLSLLGACTSSDDPVAETRGESSEVETNAETSGIPDGDADEGGDFIPDEEEDEAPSVGVLACEAFEGAPHQAVIAAASPEDAATAPMVPDPAIIYDVSLPEGSRGYLQLEIAGWGTIQAFYTSADIDYEVTTPEGEEFPYPREPLPACPESGITEQRIGFPHWSPATIEFGSEGPRLVPLLVIEE